MGSTTRLGILGLGRMGMPIALRLAKGDFDVTVFDTAPDRLALAGDHGLARASSATALARGVDILVTVLPGSAEVAQCMDDEGLLEILESGALWLDLTSSDPELLARLGSEASSRGVSCVSAPMAGGPTAAASGRLAFFVGGAATDVARARAVLAALGDTAHLAHVGERLGDGCVVKLLTNLLWFGQVIAVTEALLLGVSLGIRVGTLRASLGASAGASAFIDEYLDSLLAGDYLEHFGIDRCVEELEVLVRLAQRSDVPFELSRTVARLHREALERFGAIDGELLAARLLEERAGMKLRA